MTINIIISAFVFLLMANTSLYCISTEYTKVIENQQKKIDFQQNEIAGLKEQIECKNLDIESLRNDNSADAGISGSAIIYILLFSAVTGYVSAVVSKHRTEDTCRCRKRNKMILMKMAQKP